jgi:hypothetical protein
MEFVRVIFKITIIHLLTLLTLIVVCVHRHGNESCELWDYVCVGRQGTSTNSHTLTDCRFNLLKYDSSF